MVIQLALPADRDVYTIKKLSDLPRDQLGITRTPIFGDEASSMFYYDKTFVLDPTGISGGVAAVKENVRDMLEEFATILSCWQVKSVTLILNGNIWKYFDELLPLAVLVAQQTATFYVNGYRYMDRAAASYPPQRVNIITNEGHTCAGTALMQGLHCGTFAGQNHYDYDQLSDLFKAQKKHLASLPGMSSGALTTSFRLPGLPGPPGAADLPNDLVVYLGPGNVMYPSFQAASFVIRTFSWDQWRHMSANHTASGQSILRSQRTWVTNILIPTLAAYGQALENEIASIQAYQANHPTLSPDLPWPLLLSTLGNEEGFGSWIRYMRSAPLSAREHLCCLHEERAILQRFLAIMRPYGLNQPLHHHASRYKLDVRGIRLV